MYSAVTNVCVFVCVCVFSTDCSSKDRTTTRELQCITVTMTTQTLLHCISPGLLDSVTIDCVLAAVFANMPQAIH